MAGAPPGCRVANTLATSRCPTFLLCPISSPQVKDAPRLILATTRPVQPITAPPFPKQPQFWGRRICAHPRQRQRERNPTSLTSEPPPPPSPPGVRSNSATRSAHCSSLQRTQTSVTMLPSTRTAASMALRGKKNYPARALPGDRRCSRRRALKGFSTSWFLEG